MFTEKSTGIVEVTDQSFGSAVLAAGKPVLLDFWAEWCPTCKALTPVLEEFAAQYSHKLTIAAINADQNPETANKYSVASIPTMLLFHDGRMLRRISGSQTKATLMRELGELL